MIDTITESKVGRPTDYKPEYCEMLIEHMAEGYSFKSFGGIIGVAESTLHKWKSEHLEFSESINIGSLKSMVFWEKIGRKGMMNDIPFFNDRIWRLNMINRFRSDWIDGTKNENNDKVKTEIIVRYEGDSPNDSEATQ
jgi:hypothetical protein